jgi:activator of HSP90 ATPase
MAKNIVQTVTFPASPQTLYQIFLSSKEHSAACGAAARIVPRVGGKFTAWEGSLWGRTLLLKPGKLIVQSWRSTGFKPSDPDSILILNFSGDAKRGRITMVHANLPESDAKGVTKGWPLYYWKPWAAYLNKKQGKAGQAKRGGKRR